MAPKKKHSDIVNIKCTAVFAFVVLIFLNLLTMIVANISTLNSFPKLFITHLSYISCSYMVQLVLYNKQTIYLLRWKLTSPTKITRLCVLCLWSIESVLPEGFVSKEKYSITRLPWLRILSDLRKNGEICLITFLFTLFCRTLSIL